MTSVDENRFFFSAWGISLTLHGVVVILSLQFVEHVKPVLPESLFKWDVALFEDARSEFKSLPADSVVAQAQPPAKKAPPSQLKRVSEISKAVTPIEQESVSLPPKIEAVQPSEQKKEIPQLRQESVEGRTADVAQPDAEPTAEAKEPVAMAALPEPVAAPPVHQESVAIASAPASTTEVPISQEVNAAPVHEAKADNRWLAESLWRRVTELKRYPNAARMNGQEGKVILKAVIRSDGYLADVSVQKSSGHSALDAAAIEAVKLACPLHMKHAIGKPQIVVSLPIVYSLAN